MSSIGQTDSAALLRQVNLNHLVYFWSVARHASFTKAARALEVSQSSVSEQVRLLERRLGTVLLVRRGRGVTLTPAGELAYRYADEVAGVCSQLMRSLPLPASTNQHTIVVGTADAVPKVVVRQILRKILQSAPDACITCLEWRADQLLSELAVQRVDLVINDSPMESLHAARLVSVQAGHSNVSVCAIPTLARRYRRGFPRSLDGAPMAFPSRGSELRASLDSWFAMRRLRPQIVIEADDRSLLHHVAESEGALIPVADATIEHVRRQFGLVTVGPLAGVHEEYHVIVHDRPVRNPIVETLISTLISPKPR